MISSRLVDTVSFLRRHLRVFEVQNQAAEVRYLLSAAECSIADRVG